MNFSLDTFIGANTVLEGSIHTDCSVSVEGRVRGTIEAEGEVMVGSEGEVAADIYADSVVVGGQIIGNINARNRCEITATGRVTGDVKATRISVAEGGKVDGLFRMIDEGTGGDGGVPKPLSLVNKKLPDPDAGVM